MRDYPLDEILLPMNGNAVKDAKKMDLLWNDPNYIAEEKFDGSRYLSIGGRFFSRRISDIDGLPVEKTDRIPHLQESLSLFPDLILDGEVYYPGMTSNEVTSILGSLPDRALQLQEERGKLIYVVFDILRTLEGEWLINKPWKERRKYLENIFGIWDENRYIRLSQVVTENKYEFYQDILKRGGEGVMLKNINKTYKPDNRPAWTWVKVKKNLTDDVIITGFDAPVKEYTGKEIETWPYWEGDMPITKFYNNNWIGAIRFGKYNSQGKLVDLGTCSGITDADREMFSRNPDKFIGEVIEIGAMQKTEDGHYRHPVFVRLRNDKSAKDCII